MIIEAVCGAIVGMGIGAVAMGMTLARQHVIARADVTKWQTEFKRVVKDLANALAERDEARQQRDQAMSAIRHMQPLCDLGARRKAALDKANASKRKSILPTETQQAA